MLLSSTYTAQHLSCPFLTLRSPNPNPNQVFSSHETLKSSTRYFGLRPSSLSFSLYKTRFLPTRNFSASATTSVEQLVSDEERDHYWNSSSESFDFDASFASIDLKHLSAPTLEVKELEELPEQWRRSKLAWLCKELPSQKPGTLVRLLNAQRKWITQEDATYVAVHCMRIRENETGFRVYKWMMQQHWFKFDFALATKLADYMGKERKFSKCREIFDDIINQGRVPSESTFHILVVAYLSAPIQGCLEEACDIYNRMIQLGGYRPRLSLHNSLFRALLSKPGVSAKIYLNQAEFIFHNLETSGLEIQKDIYEGLIWLHSYQDTIDKKRINSLREAMRLAGIEESREVLVSILRICSKDVDVEEAEKAWLKLVQSDGGPPSQAFVYKMEMYSKVGEPMKSLAIFEEMKNSLGAPSVASYNKVIEVLAKAQEVELTEALMSEFVTSGLKPLSPSFVYVMRMYLNMNLYDKLESAFSLCLEKCRPNRSIYNIYLDSLVKNGNVEKAEQIFGQMVTNGTTGVNGVSCNIILSGYLSCGENLKAEKIYELMCQKKYDVDPPLMEKIDHILSLSKNVAQKPVSTKLSQDQREILVGLLLGGLQIESDEERRNHSIRFAFSENLETHIVLRRHIHYQFHEWLVAPCDPGNGSEELPYQFFTRPHSYFGFYADQFWPRGKSVIPRLIHRWLSPCALAYWYMYGGHRLSSGDIVLKLKGSKDGAERVIKALKTNSLDCMVKRKGRVFWIGFLGSNSTLFWKLVEPYILDELKDRLRPCAQSLGSDNVETDKMDFNSDSASDDNEDENS